MQQILHDEKIRCLEHISCLSFCETCFDEVVTSSKQVTFTSFLALRSETASSNKTI